MKIKNNYTSHLGFGSARILPGETIDVNQLPKGYNENHPLIKFYINQGWLEVFASKLKTAEGSSKPVLANIKIDTNAGKTTGDDKIDDKTDDGTGDNLENEIDDNSGEETGGESADGEDGTNNDGTGGSTQSKSLSRMGKAELQTLATKLGLEFSPTDSNPTLVEKIKAAQKVEE